MFLLDDLLIALPAKGLLSIFEKIYEMAEAEFTDEAKIKEDLLILQILYDSDQMNEEEYQKKEDALLERLTMVRAVKGDET
ncbi:MAG TPA: gas vesicle protein GvpG [Ktedonobacteraceae bacterium]|nr:gas vesicle protein GvpG [Ktedonobacteraceae bacterium]